MDNFQQQAPLQNQQKPIYEKIASTRVKKELEFLQSSQLKYEIQILDPQGFNTFSTSSQNPNSNLRTDRGTKIAYKVTVKETKELERVLSIYLPLNYPFQQPLYLYPASANLSKQQIQQQIQPVSNAMDWFPKYKIFEMIEYLAIKIKEKTQQQLIIQQHIIGRVFNKIGTVKTVILFAILIRVLVALGGYSGKNDWPNLGDFEAHRNWMSITINKPINQWYLQGGETIWWRIDYPPIAAYLSFIFGSIYKYIQPKAMTLGYGYESDQLTAFMRLTALITQMIFLFPPVYLLLFSSPKSLCNPLTSIKQYNLLESYKLVAIFAFLVKPDLLLIDHGHFQYNSLIMGLILSAFYCLLTKKYYVCCILFTIAVHSKQMAVYYALAFLSGLIGVTINEYRTNTVKIISELLKYGCLVIGISLIIWLPFILSGSAQLVLEAIFPVHRGLYQLKVPNFWCISDVLMKWSSHFSNKTLMGMCFFLSTLFSIPAMFCMVVSANQKTLILGFFSIAMTFFLFSYHVHQKSILLPLLMAPLLVQYLGVEFVLALVVSGTLGMLSSNNEILGMYHLLKEDNQWLQYFIVIVLYIIFMEGYASLTKDLNKFCLQTDRTKTTLQLIHQKIFGMRSVCNLFYDVILALHMFQLFIEPPQKLEYLYHLLFAFYSFVFNAYAFLLVNGILLETIFKKFRQAKNRND